MKILIHSLVFPPDGNSAAYIIGDLVEFLVQSGFSVEVITTTPHYNDYSKKSGTNYFKSTKKRWIYTSDYYGAKVYHIKTPQKSKSYIGRILSFVSFHLKAIKIAKKYIDHYDLVIGQSSPITMGYFTSKLSKIKKAKSIYIVQDAALKGLIEQKKIKNYFFIKIIKFFEIYGYMNNDVICGVSVGIVKYLENSLKNKKRSNKIVHVPNFVDTTLYSPNNITLARNNNLVNTHKFTFTYIGNIGNAQNFDFIFEALKYIEGENFEFAIYGSGIKQLDLEKRIMKQNYSEVIGLKGYIKRDKTPMIILNSDINIVTLASHIIDTSFPSKIYTILSMGKPILLIAPLESDAAKFIRKNGFGWVFDSSDAIGIASFINSFKNNYAEDYIESSEKYSKSIRKYIIDNYSKAHILNEYLNVINDLI